MRANTEQTSSDPARSWTNRGFRTHNELRGDSLKDLNLMRQANS